MQSAPLGEALPGPRLPREKNKPHLGGGGAKEYHTIHIQIQLQYSASPDLGPPGPHSPREQFQEGGGRMSTLYDDHGMYTPERHLPTPGQHGDSPQRHTAAGTAAPTTADTGNTVPQRANPSLFIYRYGYIYSSRQRYVYIFCTSWPSPTRTTFTQKDVRGVRLGVWGVVLVVCVCRGCCSLSVCVTC